MYVITTQNIINTNGPLALKMAFMKTTAIKSAFVYIQLGWPSI